MQWSRAALRGASIGLCLGASALAWGAGAEAGLGLPPVVAQVEQVCAAWPRPVDAPQVDLDAEAQALNGVLMRDGTQGLARACLAWAFVRQQHGLNSLAELRWTSGVGTALFWAKRAGEAEAVLLGSRPRLLAQSPPRRAWAAEGAAVLSALNFQRGRIDEALRWSEQAVADADAAVDEDVVDRRSRLVLRLNLGVMNSLARRHEAANIVLQQTLDEAQREPVLADVAAGAMNALATQARRQERFDEAIDWSRRVIEFRSVHLPQDALGQGTEMGNLGLLLVIAGRFDEAEVWLRRAVSLHLGTDNRDLFNLRSRTLDSLSALLLSRGKSDEALAVATQAVALVERDVGLQAGTALRPLWRLADAQSAQGDLAAAVRTWSRAAAILRSHANAGELEARQAVRLGLARGLLELGDLDAAAQALAEAREELERGRPQVTERASLLQLQATVAQRRGQRDEAAAALDAADSALAALQSPVHAQRLSLQSQQCALTGHCERLQAAMTTASSAALPEAVQALAALVLARHERQQVRHEAQALWARRAHSAALASSQPRLLWQAYAELAYAAADRDARDEAIFFAKLAIDGIERLRDNVAQVGPVSDARYLEDKIGLYRQATQWLVERSRLAEGLQVLALLKHRERDEYLLQAPTRAQDEAGVSFTPAETQARRRLEQAHGDGRARALELQRLLALRAAQRLTADEQQRLQALLAVQEAQRPAQEQALEAALAEVRVTLAPAGRADATGARPAGGPDARPAIVSTLGPAPKGTLRAWVIVGASRLNFVFQDAAGLRQRSVDLPGTGALAARIAELLERVVHRRSWSPGDPAMAELRAWVSAPLDQAAGASGARRLELTLDGPLRYLPIGLLDDGRRLLAQKYAIVGKTEWPQTAPAQPAGERARGARAGQAAPAMEGPAAAAAPRLHGFGMTMPAEGLPALPSVAEELCGIVSGPVRGLAASAPGCVVRGGPQGTGPLSGQADLNDRFTAESFRHAAAGMQNGQMLHVGTHFVLRPGNVNRSWLLLGDGSRLPLAQLREMPMGRASLVTLSACDGAAPAGAQADGREVDGLASVLLGNGAQQVLASLWRADDRMTARFMRDFYAELARQRGDAARALQRTQQNWSAAGHGSAPAHWAGFVLVSR